MTDTLIEAKSLSAGYGKMAVVRDVDLRVDAGEVVALIGPNGAGKSTLLKILSQITLPTKGEARLHGRVGALLEVGTGFHPELTGRENVFLNGAILNMKRREIQSRFEEIVEFGADHDGTNRWYGFVQHLSDTALILVGPYGLPGEAAAAYSVRVAGAFSGSSPASLNRALFQNSIDRSRTNGSTYSLP